MARTEPNCFIAGVSVLVWQKCRETYVKRVMQNETIVSTFSGPCKVYTLKQ